MTTAPSPAATSNRLRSRSLAESVAILFSLTAAQRLIGFGRSVLFCRLLAPRDLGEWEICLNWLLLVAPAVVLSLPGSFGRYVERYRSRGELRAFLRRTGLACAICAGLAAITVATFRDALASLILRDGTRGELLLAFAVTLFLVVGYQFVVELATALRLQRLASGLELINSVAFALWGSGALWGWRRDAVSVTLAFGAAGLVALFVAAPWLWATWRELPREKTPVPRAEFWSTLIPFAAWVWAANLAGNLFLIIDRQLIMHGSGLAPADAEAMIGQYHAARVIPALLMALGTMCGGLLTPYFARDWESHGPGHVSRSLDLALKIAGLGFLAIATGVTIVGPWFFGWAFADKFDEGLTVLSWTLMYAIWCALVGLAKTWLWCDERGWLVTIAFLLGLVVNAVSTAIWVRSHGLAGAVWGTCAGHATVLAVTLGMATWRGLKLSRGTLAITLLPALLPFGPGAACLGLASIAVLSLATNWILNDEERAKIRLAFASSRDAASRIARSSSSATSGTPSSAVVEV